jgi:hypothetical protein
MKFKTTEVGERFKDLHPMAQKIATEMDAWSVKNFDKELTLTTTCSTKAEDKLLNRVSDTHRTRRAWDIRVNDLSEDHIAKMCAHFRKLYGKLGAVANGQAQLIVYRPHGTAAHLHCQLNRTYILLEKDYGKT